MATMICAAKACSLIEHGDGLNRTTWIARAPRLDPNKYHPGPSCWGVGSASRKLVRCVPRCACSAI